MFKPTVNNLYYLMKDMTVKPSMYNKRLYFCRGSLSDSLAFWTILNDQKDFEIQHCSATLYKIKLTHYTYSVMNPIGDNTGYSFMIRKYDSKNSNEFIPIHNISAS